MNGSADLAENQEPRKKVGNLQGFQFFPVWFPETVNKKNTFVDQQFPKMSALRSTWLGLCSAARRAGGPLRAPAAMASAAAAQPRRTFLTTPAMRQAAAASFA